MRPVRFLLLAAALCGAGIGSGTAWADNRDAGGSWCDQNPAKCATYKARRDDYCRKNPQSCETGDMHRDARKNPCDDDPRRCDDRRDDDKRHRD